MSILTVYLWCAVAVLAFWVTAIRLPEVVVAG